GILTVASGAKSHFTVDGIPCITNCTNAGGQSPQCNISQDTVRNCSANYMNEFRCTSNNVTRHGDCDPSTDLYCCINAGYCTINALCNCTGCLNLRDKACEQHICGGEGKCYWDNTLKQPSCNCSLYYQLDPSDRKCHFDPLEFIVLSTSSDGLSCFALSQVALSWQAASNMCQIHNTTLAEPQDLKLLQMHQNATEMKYGNYWLGGQGNGTIMAWTKGAGEVYPNVPTLWEQHTPGSVLDSSYCTLYNSSGEQKIISSQRCSYLYKFICQLDRCVIPKFTGPPVLTSFSESNITVTLPNIEYTTNILSVHVVVGPRHIRGVSSNPNAESIARLKKNITPQDESWITKQWTSQTYPKDNIVIGDVHPLVQGKEYYVALVVASKQGNFALYNSSEIGGPFFAKPYRELRVRDLLATAGVTCATIWLAIGIYTIVQRCKSE
ncbi:unnamed protein product, partial [Meganyctiphanes norvegica]